MSHREYVAGLSDRELEELRREVQRVQVARKRADTSPEKIEREIEQYQKSMGRVDGAPWEQPVSALDAYPRNALVTHDGGLWRSTVAANVWAPGQSGWRLEPKTDEDGNEIPPPYVQPSGSHDSYMAGERVTFDGEVWEAVRDGVVHSPAEYAADWQLIEPEPDPEPGDPKDPEPGDGDDGEDEDPDPDEPDPEPEIPEWNPNGHAYTAGDLVTHQGTLYVVRQDHTSQAGWTPGAVPALYEAVDSP